MCAVAGYGLTSEYHAGVGAVHGYIDITREAAGLHLLDGDMARGSVNQRQLGITQCLQLGIPGNHDIARTALVKRQHGVHQRDGGTNRLWTVIVVELMLYLRVTVTVVISELDAHLQFLATPLVRHLPANLRRMVVVVVSIALQHPADRAAVAGKADQTTGGVDNFEFAFGTGFEGDGLVLVARLVVSIVEDTGLALTLGRDVDVTPRDAIVRRGVPDEHWDGVLNLAIAHRHPGKTLRFIKIPGTAVGQRVQAHCQQTCQYGQTQKRTT